MENQALLAPGQVANTPKCGLDVFSSASPILAIAMIVIGHLYLYDCRVQPYIPIFLLVSGYFIAACNFLYAGMRCCWRDNVYCVAVRYFYSLMGSFLLVWYIMGSVWVYGVQKVNFEDTASQEYCNKTVYYFAFYFLCVLWPLFGFIILCVCCCACLAALNPAVMEEFRAQAAAEHP